MRATGDDVPRHSAFGGEHAPWTARAKGIATRSVLPGIGSWCIASIMVMRCLLALFLVLSGIMVAASPVAAMAMSDRMLCEPQIDVAKPAGAGNHHKAHAHHDADAADEPLAAEQTFPVCCDHACLSEVTVLAIVAANGRADHRATFSLSSGDRPDLIGRKGLRRPPKV